MSARLPIALALACGVAFGLFYLMSVLIALDAEGPADEIAGQSIDFLRVKEESETRTKERRMPKKIEQADAPPPPDIDMMRSPKPSMSGANANVVALPAADLATASIGGALSDMDVVPLVRVPPEYPRRAAEKGTKGWVLLEFTVTAAGTVEDVVVVDSEPPRTFDRAATKAALRYKYRPKIENGQPVPRRGVRVIIDFQGFGEEG